MHENEEALQTAKAPRIDPKLADRRRILTFVFFFALAIRFINLICLSRYSFFGFKIGDAARYDEWAHRIADGNWLGSEVFYQAPLYPYFLATIYATIGDNIFVTKLIQAGIGALSCALLAATAWNLFNRRAAVVAGIVMACYVPSIFLESLLQKSVLDLFFVSLILWLFSRILVEQERLRLWLMLGAAVGFLCLTRENALALIPIFGLASLIGVSRKSVGETLRQIVSELRRRIPRNVIRSVPLYVGGLLLVLGPVAVRNYWIGGEFHITTSQLGPNFYIGNNPEANGYYRPLVFGRGDAKYEQADAITIAEQATGRKLKAGEVSDYYMSQSLGYISKNPLSWLSLIGKKAMLSINYCEIVDTEDQYVVEKYSPLLRFLSPIFNFGVLLPFALIGLWQARSRWQEMWALFLVLGIFQLTLVAFFVFGRYRFPVVPLMVLFAAPVLSQWITFVKQTRWNVGSIKTKIQEKSGLIFLFSVSFFLAHWPMVTVHKQAGVTYNNFANQSLIRGDMEKTGEYLNKSLAYDPSFALTYNTKGVWYRELGELEKARVHFEKAIEISPEYELARNNLARLGSNE